MRFIISLFFATLALCVYGQTEQEAAQNIRSNPSYKCGEGRGVTEHDARKNALQDLALSCKAVVNSVERVTTDSGMSGQTYSEEMEIMSQLTFNNAEFLTWQDGDDYVAFAYVSVADLAKAKDERRANIKTWAELGWQQEKKLNISGALKYYGWALRMIGYYKEENIQIDINGQSYDAAVWLPEKIKSVLSHISIKLDNNKIEYDPSEYDKYAVNLSVTYNGKPVSALDLSYFNGEKLISPLHAKSGEATLFFPELQGRNVINTKVVYNYFNEGQNFNDELKLSYNDNSETRKQLDNQFSQQSAFALPVAVSDLKIDVDKRKAAMLEQQRTVDDYSEELAPAQPKEYKTIERNMVTDQSEVLVEAMKSVEQAIRTGRYETVQSLFTPEGYTLFMTMMRSGKVRVTKTPQYSVETSTLFTIGKQIPVSVKVGKHTSNENIVFRFDRSSGLITSVAYALTRKAEDDIFRQASWNLESRYSLLTFMEDYQTAFALKRLDFIKKIFSDDAIIIVGQFTGKKGLSGLKEEDLAMGKSSKAVSYKHYNKEQYIYKLEQDFAAKQFIQIVFEENEISKAPTNGLLENEVLWIEIKQHYISNNYSDKGFLGLQINMRPQGSQINVRTWSPIWIPLSVLKEKYPIGGKMQ